jgi:helix-turn-helix protein
MDTLPGFDPARDLVLEPRMLRGLAHPLRIRLRAELVEHGPATATQLAARVGQSSGATSYHLRQLAAYGFVTDEPGRGNGRERYWRATHRMLSFDMPEAGSSQRAVGGAGGTGPGVGRRLRPEPLAARPRRGRGRGAKAVVP